MTLPLGRWVASNGEYRGFDGGKNERAWAGPFYFVVLADPQLGMSDDNRTVAKEVDALTEALRQIGKLQPLPRFIIVCGDLVNAHTSIYPDTVTAEMVEEQSRALQLVFREASPSGIPLLCVCGNHDVGNRPTPEFLEEYRTRFGDDYFSFWCGGVKGLVINTQLYSDPSGAVDAAERHDQWFRSELGANQVAPAKHLLVFGHIPWYLYHEGEEDDVGTSSSYRGQIIPDGYFHVPKARRQDIMACMNRAGVRASFAGHWHQNGGHKPPTGFEMIITSAIADQLSDRTESGFRLVCVQDAGIRHEYFTTPQHSERMAFLVDHCDS